MLETLQNSGFMENNDVLEPIESNDERIQPWLNEILSNIESNEDRILYNAIIDSDGHRYTISKEEVIALELVFGEEFKEERENGGGDEGDILDEFKSLVMSLVRENPDTVIVGTTVAVAALLLALRRRVKKSAAAPTAPPATGAGTPGGATTAAPAPTAAPATPPPATPAAPAAAPPPPLPPPLPPLEVNVDGVFVPKDIESFTIYDVTKLATKFDLNKGSENERKMKHYALYEELRNKGVNLTEVDDLRKVWARGDGLTGDYIDDQFIYQTGEALLQVLEKKN
jgi:hypothetical protein